MTLLLFIHLRNRDNREDDDFHKVVAPSITAADKYAERWCKTHKRFSVGGIYSEVRFRKLHPGWFALLESESAFELDKNGIKVSKDKKISLGTSEE